MSIVYNAKHQWTDMGLSRDIVDLLLARHLPVRDSMGVDIENDGAFQGAIRIHGRTIHARSIKLTMAGNVPFLAPVGMDK